MGSHSFIGRCLSPLDVSFCGHQQETLFYSRRAFCKQHRNLCNPTPFSSPSSPRFCWVIIIKYFLYDNFNGISRAATSAVVVVVPMGCHISRWVIRGTCQQTGWQAHMANGRTVRMMSGVVYWNWMCLIQRRKLSALYSHNNRTRGIEGKNVYFIT